MFRFAAAACRALGWWGRTEARARRERLGRSLRGGALYGAWVSPVDDENDPLSRLRPLVISAPFGNYVQPAGLTPTVGTFTALRRRGRVQQIVKTVRWYPWKGAWVNRIGLRNPGLAWYAGKVAAGRIDPSGQLVSIHGFDDAEWGKLVPEAAALKPLGMELNMSCPNVGHINWPAELFADAVAAGAAHGVGVVVKLPPVNWEQMAAQAVDAGVRAFHCCNTLPVAKGGMSGKPLLPVALGVVRAMRERFGDSLRLIGGGGITGPRDVAAYREAGADHYALGTKVMNPRYLVSGAGLGRLKRAAESGMCDV